MAPRRKSGAADLAGSLPPGLTVHVELPEVRHDVPDDEAAVALERVAVNPAPMTDAGTTSIEIAPGDLVVHPEPEAVDVADETPAEVAPLPEDPEALTEERLLAARRRGRGPGPEGFWQHLVWTITFRLVDLGDSKAVRARKAIDARIGKRFVGGARFVPVLSRKGGVGKTTITALLGMALADVRDDRVIAVDANPDRGTLADRVSRRTHATVRDLVIHAPDVKDFAEFSAHVSRDATRLDVLASDPDPAVAEAFGGDDYNVVADLASRFYSLVLTDCGTGLVHSAMRATLQRADAVVIVSGGSLDEARLASETLTWLEANNYGHLAKNAVVAINTATQGTNLVKLDEIEGHFRSRVRAVVRIPYDEELAAGSVIRFEALRPFTRESARELAATLVDGLPAERES